MNIPSERPLKAPGMGRRAEGEQSCGVMLISSLDGPFSLFVVSDNTNKKEALTPRHFQSFLFKAKTCKKKKKKENNPRPLSNCQQFAADFPSSPLFPDACSVFVLNKFQLITRQMVQNVLCDHYNPVCYAH